MPDYIEREAAIKAAVSAVHDQITAVNVVSALEEAPAADVAEVRHGRWIICCDGYYPYCSECRNEPQGREMTNYCPNCGARMDGEGKK